MNKKMYVIYESNCHDLQCDGCNITDLVMITENKDKAIQEVLNIIKDESNYVLDECDKKIVKQIDEYIDNLHLTMFYEKQENWNCYFEINCELKNIE